VSLPSAAGPLAVGSITHELVDAGRPAHLLSSVPGRGLFLKLWYPAEPAPAIAPELLWGELRQDARVPLLVRGLLGLMRRRSASHPRAALAVAAPAVLPVLYNHGLISFAAENTSLMQELASRGHIVIALQHREQLAEWQALNRQQPGGQSARALSAQIRRSNARQRAQLARQLYEASVNTNRMVLERAKDTVFALDNLASVIAAIPGQRIRAVPPLAHLVGYSVGGAVATEVALRDARVASAVNIDGGTYGSIDVRSVRVPYLMMYSAANEAINDELLPADAVRVCAPGTLHLNFHDVSGLVPPLRWIGALGAAEPLAALRWRNQTVAEFVARAGGQYVNPPGVSGVAQQL
jgi:dienelactone hydrolase